MNKKKLFKGQAPSGERKETRNQAGQVRCEPERPSSSQSMKPLLTSDEYIELSRELDWQWIRDLPPEDYKFLSSEMSMKWTELCNRAVCQAVAKEREKHGN